MHPGIEKVARLAYSFPLYDKVVRLRLSNLEQPALVADLRALKQAGRGTILAVALAHEEVIIGYSGPKNPTARAVIGGRMVRIPERDPDHLPDRQHRAGCPPALYQGQRP
jgi:hypothetical protein